MYHHVSGQQTSEGTRFDGDQPAMPPTIANSTWYSIRPRTSARKLNIKASDPSGASSRARSGSLRGRGLDRSGSARETSEAWLLKKVFLVDITECPDCGRMHRLEGCTERRDIHRVLAAHGFAPRAPPSTEWTPLGQLRFSFCEGVPLCERNRRRNHRRRTTQQGSGAPPAPETTPDGDPTTLGTDDTAEASIAGGTPRD